MRCKYYRDWSQRPFDDVDEQEGHQLKELSEYFSFFVPGHRYMPAFKRRVWDGKIRLFNQMTRELNVGLWHI